MRKGIMKRIGNERGVAMITVLFIGAVLTVTASTATFVAIEEFRAGGDDRRAAQALGYAEAGVDRFILELRRGFLTWNQLYRAGCEDGALVIDGIVGDSSRTYRSVLAVPDCAVRPSGPADPKPLVLGITATGSHPAAKRVVRQYVEVKPLNLPIGVYADSIDANGNASMSSVSLISPGDIIGREKIGFSGLDPYYTIDRFYANGNTSAMPAAAHALGAISFIKSSVKSPEYEHGPEPNCDANPRGDQVNWPGQSVWDGSGTATGVTLTTGCGHPSGFPPRSKFTEEDLKRVAPTPQLSEQDYQTLKEVAKTSGIYCAPGDSGNFNCSFAGGSPVSIGSVLDDNDLVGKPLPKNFTIYVDFPAGPDPFASQNQFKFHANISPCSSDPALNRSAILVTRNGGVSMQNGSYLNGAVFVPEGPLDNAGSYTIHGTVIAKQIRIRGGADFQLSSCWVQNLPGPFLDVVPTRWSEVDR